MSSSTPHSLQPLGATPTPYRGVEHSVGAMKQVVHSPRGAWSPLVRLVTEQVIREVSPKDYLSAALAIRYWMNLHCRYTKDPRNVEWIRDPQGILEQMLSETQAKMGRPPRDEREAIRWIADARSSFVLCDCDEFAALACAMWLSIGNRADFVTVGFGQNAKVHTHVFARCELPKTSQFIVVDPVAGSKEADMLARAGDFTIYRMD